MNTFKKIGVPAGVAAILVAIIVVWHYTHMPPDPLVAGQAAGTQNVRDFTQFQQELAARVLKQFGAGPSDPDFSVIVAIGDYPLGTLIRTGSSIPADSSDCAPASAPKPLAAEHLFPSYTVSGDTAATVNLGQHTLDALDSAGVDLRHSSKVEYSIAGTQILIMDDKAVEQVTHSGGCRDYVATHPGLRLIRGSVTGKMTFTIDTSNPASVKAQFDRFGGFAVTDNPGSSTLRISDQAVQPIVELLSEFTPPTATGAAPQTAAPPPPKPVQLMRPAANPPAAASPAAQGPHIFIQQDRADPPGTGEEVAALLRSGWPKARVESHVELIPTEKMPPTAQVRYFNSSDEASAKRCVDLLKSKYPEARAVRIGVSAPIGQLEIWTPRRSVPAV